MNDLCIHAQDLGLKILDRPKGFALALHEAVV